MDPSPIASTPVFVRRSSPLKSQFDTLEEPDADEHPVTVIVQDSAAQTVLELLRRLGT
jgi:gluconate kinase